MWGGGQGLHREVVENVRHRSRSHPGRILRVGVRKCRGEALRILLHQGPKRLREDLLGGRQGHRPVLHFQVFMDVQQPWRVERFAGEDLAAAPHWPRGFCRQVRHLNALVERHDDSCLSSIRGHTLPAGPVGRSACGIHGALERAFRCVQGAVWHAGHRAHLRWGRLPGRRPLGERLAQARHTPRRDQEETFAAGKGVAGRPASLEVVGPRAGRASGALAATLASLAKRGVVVSRPYERYV
mmetsp:Transcript_7817/g.22422  ORF Transcript_7817/g.22422 Transcript_7817/m.22422 type:complete len:241 (-) Transcript_7817:2-724(-)